MSPQLFYKSAFIVTLVAFVKKPSQYQWSLASQENRIGFVGFGVCFDLLGPKFSIRAGRLKKGAREALGLNNLPRLTGKLSPKNELKLGVHCPAAENNSQGEGVDRKEVRHVYKEE